METKSLQKIFEDHEFHVHLFEQDGKQCAELEKWTNRGVDMLIYLQPFTAKEFIKYVNDFDIDELIDLHRQDQGYKDAFKISESVKDFTEFHDNLKEIERVLIDKERKNSTK